MALSDIDGLKRQFEGAPEGKSALYFLLFSGAMLGLGILTKGQVAYLVFFLTAGLYWLWHKGKAPINIPNFILVSAVMGMVMLGWYGLETLKHGPWFVIEFTKYQASLFSAPSAGHSGFPGYHFVVLLLGVFPASVFGLATLITSKTKSVTEKDFYRWMFLFFWVVLILFTMARSKIVHYSSLCYFPITYFAALFLHQWINEVRKWRGWTTGFLIGIGALYVLAPILFTWAAFNQDFIQSFLKEGTPEWAAFNMDVHWTGFEAVPGILMLILIIGTLVLKKRQNRRLLPWVLFLGTAVYILLTIALLVWRIERYSQGSHIDFLKEKSQENCYVHPSGFKSYAPFFYLEKMPHEGFDPAKRPDPSLGATFNIHKSSNEDWLYWGHVDRPVYVVSKYRSNQYVEAAETMSEIYREGSFIFYERDIYRPCQIWKYSACPPGDTCTYSGQYLLNYEDVVTSRECYDLKTLSENNPYQGNFCERLEGMLIESPPLEIPVEELKGRNRFFAQLWIRTDAADLSWILKWENPESGLLETRDVPISVPSVNPNRWVRVESTLELPNVKVADGSMSIRLFNKSDQPLDVDELLITIP